MKLRILNESAGYLFVDDEWEEIRNRPWDSGFTPEQVMAHITKGLHPELEGSYDVEATKWAMEQIRISDGNVQPVLVDVDLDVVDGYHRIAAAKILGMKKIPYKEI